LGSVAADIDRSGRRIGNSTHAFGSAIGDTSVVASVGSDLFCASNPVIDGSGGCIVATGRKIGCGDYQGEYNFLDTHFSSLFLSKISRNKELKGDFFVFLKKADFLFGTFRSVRVD
jgi:hypothetical protein